MRGERVRNNFVTISEIGSSRRREIPAAPVEKYHSNSLRLEIIYYISALTCLADFRVFVVLLKTGSRPGRHRDINCANICVDRNVVERKRCVV